MAALARPDPHHGHEAQDLRQALVFGKDVCRVVLARDFEEEQLPRLDALLKPQVGCSQVADATKPLALANADGGCRVGVYLYGYGVAEVIENRLQIEDRLIFVGITCEST